MTNVIAVAAGDDHSLALKADGTVWAWGANSDGQLGDGTPTMRLSAVQVPGLSGVTSIEAGGNFSLALQSEGATAGILWAWGGNAYSQLGDGSTLKRESPVRVPAVPLMRQIHAGTAFAFAIDADGRIWTWGRNEYGQLGRSISDPAGVPAIAPPIDRVAIAAAGASFGIVIDPFGRGWSWGRNNHAQRASGDYREVPNVQLAYSLPLSVRVSSHGEFLLGIALDGRVYGIGNNMSQQLGAPLPGSSPTPVYSGTLQLADNTWLLGDADQDGLPTWREYHLSTDPVNADTNGNGVTDGIEAFGGTAANHDSDGDGSPTWIEVARGSDPFRADTDGDGVLDGADAFPLDPTRSTETPPVPGDTTPPTITLTEPATARPIP